METEYVIYKFTEKSKANECFKKIMELFYSLEVSLDLDRCLIMINEEYYLLDHAIHLCEKYNGKRQIVAR
jgi:hypothetical protein